MLTNRRAYPLITLLAAVIALPLAADGPVTEKVDLDAVYRRVLRVPYGEPGRELPRKPRP